MPKKERIPEPAESKSLIERIAPILERADSLGPFDPNIDQKALADWICGDDQPLSSNAIATCKDQGEYRSLDPALAKAHGRLDQIDGRLSSIQDSIVKKSDVWIAAFTASIVVAALAKFVVWVAW